MCFFDLQWNCVMYLGKQTNEETKFWTDYSKLQPLIDKVNLRDKISFISFSVSLKYEIVSN